MRARPRRGSTIGFGTVAAWLALAFAAGPAQAVVFLDDERAISLTLKTYTQARILTQEPERFRKGYTLLDTSTGQESFQETFAVDSGSLLQHRNYLEPQLNIDLSRRAHATPALRALDHYFLMDNFKYFMGARIEYDGLYDYGPNLYTDEIPSAIRDDLRYRARLFEMYGDFRLADRINWRVGKQNLSWGEADVFRILDIINPLDQTFGGFLTPLDERRVPSFMVKGLLDVGSGGPFYNVALEGFIEPKPELVPGPTVPQEAPWAVITGPPSPLSLRMPSKKRWNDARTGGRLLFNVSDYTITTAHYWTYPETPTPLLKFDTSLTDQVKAAIPETASVIDEEFPKGTPYLELAYPRITATGATLSGPLPFSPYTILRTEGAILADHPYFLATSNIPILGPTFEIDDDRRTKPEALTDTLRHQKAIIDSGRAGTLPRSDLFKWAVGFDHNQWFRILNPRQTFFISAQLIGEHWKDLEEGASLSVQRDAFVARVKIKDKGTKTFSQPDFIPLKANGYKSTFLIQTGYTMGRGYLAPSFAMIAEYGEFDAFSYLYQPGLAYLIAPFQIKLEYNRLGGDYSGGVGLLKDRDNILVRLDVFIDQAADYLGL